MSLSTRRHAVLNPLLSTSRLYLDFPLPPPLSPTPSLSTSPSLSSHSSVPRTPLHDDDSDNDSFFLASSPSSSTSLPRRLTIKPLLIHKHPQQQQQQSIEQHSDYWLDDAFSEYPESINELDLIESDNDEANAFYAHEFSQILTLSSPLPPHLSTATAAATATARPESVFLPSHLDPTYQRRKHTNKITIPPIPKHAPPPPPVPVRRRPPTTRPTARPTALHHYRHSLRRPPPRTSVPADVLSLEDCYEEDEESDGCPSSAASVCSQDRAVRIDPCDFAIFETEHPHSHSHDDDDDDDSLSLRIPFSPLDLETDFAFGLLELERRNREEAEAEAANMAVRSRSSSPTPTPSIVSSVGRSSRVLRSRWSTSTMSTVVTRREDKTKARVVQNAAAKLKGYLGGAKKAHAPAPPVPPKPQPRHPGVSVRWSESSRDSTGSNVRTWRESQGVTARKPIPVEMFLRS